MPAIHYIRSQVRFLTILPVMLVLAACGNLFFDDKDMVRSAIKYMEANEYPAAVIQLKNALEKNPDNAQARYLLGSSYLIVGDYANAEKEFRRAEEAGWQEYETRTGIARALLGQRKYRELLADIPVEDAYPRRARAELLAMRADAEAATGETDKASVTLANAVLLDSQAFQVLRVTAQFQIVANDLVEAGNTLATALEEYPANPELHLLNAYLSLQSGNEDSAKVSFQKIFESESPGNLTVYSRQARLGLARLQVLAKEFEQATATIAPLRMLNPEDPYANYLAGIIGYLEGDYEIAERRFLEVLKVAPQHEQTRLLLGAVNFAQADYEQAAYFISKYLVMVPDNLVARKLLGRSYIILGKHYEARTVLNAETGKQSEDTELLTLVALAELRGGDAKAGISGLAQALAASPDSIALRGELARAYFDTGETEHAIAELSKLIETGGKQKHARMLLVLSHLRAGEFDHAVNLVLDLQSEYPDDKAVLILTGQVFAASGDRLQARQYINHALQIEPGFPQGIMVLAQIEEADGNTGRAVELYNSLVETSGALVDPMLALARIAESQGRYPEMVEWLEKARAGFPDEIRPRLLLAEYYLRNKEAGASRALINEILDLSPEETMVLVMEARTLIAEGQYEKALDPIRELIERQPGSVLANTLLGESYLGLGKIDNAREQLSVILERMPYFSPALILMAKLEIESGDFDRALEYSARIQQVKSDNEVGFVLAGNAWLAKKNLAEAASAYALAWQRKQSAELAIKLAEIEVRLGKPEDAVAHLSAWLSGHPDDARVHQSLAIVYLKAGRQDKAIAEFERILEIEPANTAALNNLAWLYASAGDPAAIGYGERALEANPDSPAIMDTYGWVLVQLGKPEQGRQLLEKAVKKLPGVPEVRYHYAVALLKTGEQEEGLRMLNVLLSEDRPFDGRDEALALLGKRSDP